MGSQELFAMAVLEPVLLISVFQVGGITGMSHSAQFFSVEMLSLELFAEARTSVLLISASQVARIIGVSHCTWLYFIFFFFVFEMKSLHVAQPGVDLLGSSDPPASVSPVAGTTGVNFRAWPMKSYFS
jgi:hypothetical protein